MPKKFRLKINKRKMLYVIILFLAFCLFVSLAIFNVFLKKQNSLLEIYPPPIDSEVADYPSVNKNYIPYISAEGAVVIDKDSQVPIFEKNPNLRFPPASTTKIMTAIVALEYYKPEDVLVIFKKDPEGVDLGFSIGEKFTFESLLYAMMLPSSNDATLAIAQNYPGGESAFVAEMNKKAEEFNLINTRFEDPVGLLDKKDYSTSIDLARLTTIALNNSKFASVVSTKQRKIVDVAGREFRLENLNILLGTSGINGVKTGYTEGAGQVLVTSKKLENGKDLIFVVMQSQDRFGDTLILLNYLDSITFSSIRY